MSKRRRNLTQDVKWLADRLALAMTLIHDDLRRAIVVLPSREDDRELIRGDEVLGSDYHDNLAMVRQVLRDAGKQH